MPTPAHLLKILVPLVGRAFQPAADFLVGASFGVTA